MADYERSTLLTTICTNLSGTVLAGTAYQDVRALRGIVTAAGGTPTPVAGTYEQISLLDDWITAIGASAPATADYSWIERLRVIATKYAATVLAGSDREDIRTLRAIAAAT